MSLTTAFAIYFIVWWLVLFAVLPFGVRSQRESGDVAPGSDPGAPAIAHLGRKLLWTTLLSCGVFALLYVVHHYRLISIDDLANLIGVPG